MTAFMPYTEALNQISWPPAAFAFALVASVPRWPWAACNSEGAWNEMGHTHTPVQSHLPGIHLCNKHTGLSAMPVTAYTDGYMHTYTLEALEVLAEQAGH